MEISHIVLGVLGAVLGLWILLSLKTSRPDGDLLRVHPYRRLMVFIMPTRNESVVYFDYYIPAEKLEAYVSQARERFGANLTHCMVGAINMGLGANPTLNRFVAGRRLYQRRGRWLTFSMKRKKLNRRAKISVVKLPMKDGESFRELCERINSNIKVERSGKKTTADKEFQLFNALPRPVLRGAAALLRELDYFNLLPNFFIESDAMYSSAVIANLGSLNMDAGYHHLYEYGNSPFFFMVGRVEARPVVEGDAVVARRQLHIRVSFDERTDDGLNGRHGLESMARVLADPFTWLGCLAEDGSDTHPMWPREGFTAVEPEA